jgi:hypothetical protein
VAPFAFLVERAVVQTGDGGRRHQGQRAVGERPGARRERKIAARSRAAHAFITCRDAKSRKR